jgi:CubicO group peptidase (beta-lactamase class C family)
VPECLAAHPLRCDAEPGTAFAYSNWGYALLGHLVETVVGQPFADVARSSLFEPIGMADTGYVLMHSSDDRLATGYLSIGAVFTSPVQILVPQGAGSVFSTTADVGRYARAVLDREVPGVSATLVDDALTLAWATGRSGRTERHAWHTGGWTGFSSILWLDLDARRATALLANSTQVSGAPGLEEPAIGLTSVD